jgi:hypothetical protein
MDIDTGHYILNDVFSDPFNFPSRVKYRFLDHLAPDPPKEMVLLSREDVSSALPKMRERDVLGGLFSMVSRWQWNRIYLRARLNG